MDDDEREAIKSLYCMPGECCFEGDKVTINLLVGFTREGNVSNETKFPVKIVLTVGSDYPQTIPDISILSGHLHRNHISRIKSAVTETFADYTGEPMLTAICSFLQDEIKSELEQLVEQDSVKTVPNSQSVMKSSDSVWTSVLHIDHMRSEKRYCKTLEKWAEELQLNGRILFFRRLILVVLQGNHGSIKEFILQLRTVNVDVDSKGHSCKERMMKVLSERKYDSNSYQRFPDFKKCECTEEWTLHNMFSQYGLQDSWESVIPLLKQFR